MNNENNNNTINAVVKWYDKKKGFGFIESDELDSDIFLHFSALELSGMSQIYEGDEISCEVAKVERGYQVARIISVKFCPKQQWTPPAFLGKRVASYNDEYEEMGGSIKWFNPFKGYGFIIPDDNKSEIFLHATVLKESGYDMIDPGVRVIAKSLNKGNRREAKAIEVIH